MSAFVSSTNLYVSRPAFGRSVSPRSRSSPRHNLSRTRHTVSAVLDALIFDCDGVLADTEKDAHRVAFNMAFKEKELNVVWDEPLYGRLLETGGGKERMTAYWNGLGAWPEGYEDEESRKALVKELHARKTELFMELVAGGNVPLRDGVARLVGEARAAGVKIAVCSTSNEKAVQKIVDMLGPECAAEISVFAGDIVSKKKPSPDVYNLAASELNVDPANVFVVEDSFIGLSAARAANMPCLVTKSTYTVNEDFSAAQKVVDSLDKPRTSLEQLTGIAERLRLPDDPESNGSASDPPKGGVRPARRRYGSSYL